MATPHSPALLDRIRGWLSVRPVAFTVIAAAAAFGAYTAMYAFRKPFTAATFSGQRLGGLDFKVLLVVAQILGYTVSKFAGIKVVSEATPARRIGMIAGLIGFSFVALVLFPLVPPPVRVVCLFLNGAPLGMIWGLIFSFLEGRRVTEFLGLGLSVSFIFASGWTKSAGGYAMHAWHVPENWMPAVTGALFIPLLGLCLAVMAALPAPDAGDVAERTQRQPMDAPARRRFLREFFGAIALLTVCYVGLTVYRDLRDSFMADALRELGHHEDASVFARVETFAGVGVMMALGGLWWVRDHWSALALYHVVIAAGAVLVGLSTWLFQAGLSSPFWWLALTGLGVYLAYVPFNSILFDRLLAATQQVGTATFLIYVADSLGYLGSASLYLGRTLFGLQAGWARVTVLTGMILSMAAVPLLIGSWIILQRHRRA
jgi:hypothetical protein